MSPVESRHISRLTRNTLAIILAGGQGSRLHELTQWRAKPAVPFGGKFRIIDFPLSNCINSGIRRIGVATQYKAHSLVSHILHGWAGFKVEFGEFIDILPASQRIGEGWYKGTADAVYQNLDILRTHEPEYLLILGGDHIYKMDYGPLIARHVELSADLTVCCVEVSTDEARNAFGVMEVDTEGRIIGFEEKPAEPKEIPGRPGRVLASMGNYVFNADYLYDALIQDADDEHSAHDFGKNILPDIVARGGAWAYRLGDDRPEYPPYWRDVGTIDSFWQANMELIGVDPQLDMYDKVWPIYTHQVQLPPAKFVHNEEDRRGMAVNSILSGGCIVSGAMLDRCLLFSNVRVNSWCHLTESVILPDVVIGRHSRIHRAIIDRGTVLPPGTIVGMDADEDRAKGYRVTAEGITLVTPDHLHQTLHRIR